METRPKKWQYAFHMSHHFMTSRLESLLDRRFRLGDQRVRLVGFSSPLPVAMFLAQHSYSFSTGLPHLVVTASSSEAKDFIQLLEFFDPKLQAHFLPEYDVTPYSGLEPKRGLSAERIHFLHCAQTSKPGDIFVASVFALMQNTVSFEVLLKATLKISEGIELHDNIKEQLVSLGYQSAPLVEDVGQFSYRGGILDIFSPATPQPVRIELFGDTVSSLRTFSTVDQRSLAPVKELVVLPARESLYGFRPVEDIVKDFLASLQGRTVDHGEKEDLVRALTREAPFPGVDHLAPLFFSKCNTPLEHFSSPLNIWWLDPLECQTKADHHLEEYKSEFLNSETSLFRLAPEKYLNTLDSLGLPEGSKHIECATIAFHEAAETEKIEEIPYSCASTLELSQSLAHLTVGSDSWLGTLRNKIQKWQQDHIQIVVGIKNKIQIDRLKILLESLDLRLHVAGQGESLFEGMSHLDQSQRALLCIPRYLPEGLRVSEEQLVFLREEDLFGKKIKSRASHGAAEDFQSQAKRLAFGELKPGDNVVHVKHGIGLYEGLKVMNIAGVDSEFIQIAYKDRDKLYLPVYRVGQLTKYSGHGQVSVLDKLGGQSWEKAKSKVRSHLRDIASDLLNLYANRARLSRPAFVWPEQDFAAFEAAFPYDETEDQARAIKDISLDLKRPQPMDRLICGDVGFGKTEVAMRAAFLAVASGKQVVVLAPTTVLTFQHLETFKKRFKGWPVRIEALNRFLSTKDSNKIISDCKSGQVQILIGTHRLLSRDVDFQNLGLLIVDEEQKFGVAHKEKIRKLKQNVDTLAMSATPIPRTLNMSLVGIRDISLINTAPVDRLPTRTFISKFEPSLIKKAIESEISRGGQVYFIHNRVQSIYGLADELRQIVPGARMAVAHGQMKEHELEETMLKFFNHELDVLICTAIVESGMDVSRANTMFIDQAQLLGLSQLYQLRGRVGRSKQRAYCYLLLPRGKTLDKDAQERLRVIQENTALGSGLKIAQYDLELRGSGNILGEEQAGHVNAVGYELYMDLLNEAISATKGLPSQLELDPEINLRIPAMIPDSYISDIRLRLSYYKALADIESTSDIEKIEEELKDQFGEPPEPVFNLMGLMLIRKQCKDLGVRDISAGPKNISLIFTEQTKLKPEQAIKLAQRENKKYSITPDSRLNIRMNAISWPAVYEELQQLLRLADN
jgi:transcription-repair coupling factor (superfamily II helicase)